MENKSLITTLAIALSGGMLLCLYLIGTREMAATQALLLGLLLTLLSVLASWLASGYYSAISFNKSLRMYALKAAEKVGNLSDELDRLSLYIQQEVEADDYKSADHELLAKELCMESAVHIIQTLKSVNDKSLSDWQGVIGDEINQQREKREEREADMRELADEIESLYSERLESIASAQDENAAFLGSQIESLKGELRSLASQSGIPVRGRRGYTSIEPNATAACPTCGNSMSYRQKLKLGTFKALTCKACGTKLLSRCDGDGFVVETRRPVAEQVACPNCNASQTVNVDNWPGGLPTTLTCNACNIELVVTRTKTSISVRTAQGSGTAKSKPVERILSLVLAELPKQPWPKGTSKTIAERLSLRHSAVSGAIAELIRRGHFLPQIDGKLFVPMPGTGNTDPPVAEDSESLTLPCQPSESTESGYDGGS